MKKRKLEKRIACMALSGALIFTNASGVFAAELPQTAEQSADQSGDQSDAQSQIGRIQLVHGSITKTHATYKKLTCGSSMSLGVNVYYKDGSLASEEDSDVTVTLQKKDGSEAQTVFDLGYHDSGDGTGEYRFTHGSGPDIDIYAPYGYEEKLELIVSSKKDPSVKKTYSFETVQDDRDGTSPVKFVIGKTAGKVTVGKEKFVWNAKTKSYTVTFPKVKTTNKADQFVGWAEEDSELLYTGSTVEVRRLFGIEIYDAVWKNKTGTQFTVEHTKGKHYKLNYVVTGKDTVTLKSYQGLCKCIHGLTLPNTVEFHNTTYRVTAIANKAFAGANLKSLRIGKNVERIGKNAFQNDGYLKSILVQSTNIKSVGTNAFADLKEDTLISCPNKKVKTYQKLFRKAGLNKKVKVAGYVYTKK